MRFIVSRTLKWLVLLVVLGALAFLGTRAFSAFRGPALQPWHTFVPEELTRTTSTRRTGAATWRAEEQIFASVRREVTEKLEPEARVLINRYFEGSPVYPRAVRARTGTAPTSWSPMARPAAWSCCCTA